MLKLVATDLDGTFLKNDKTISKDNLDTNPIMLTSDNGLQVKTKGLGITTITLKEFLKHSR